jgi:chromosome segregation ATPase
MTALEDLETEMDSALNKLASMRLKLRRAEARIAELEVAVEYATKAIAGTRQDTDACIAGLKVRIAKLEAACKKLLKRLDALERYAAGYRVGRVPESVFDALEQTRDAENEARAALEHKEA